MTIADSFARPTQARKHFSFPDPPEDPEDKMTNFHEMADTGSLHHLKQHLGNPDETLVAGEKYLALAPTSSLSGMRYPDLLVAFGVEPDLYYQHNAYVIDEQGKPPDFVLEVASRSSGRLDTVDKRRDYAALEVPEYWRFDETGRYHGTRLAGDRLVDGEYVPIEIEELPDGSLQGSSAVLGLNLRWELSGLPQYTRTLAQGLPRGRLGWYDPATGRHIMTYDAQRERADAAEVELDFERARAEAAEVELDFERTRAEAESARAEAAEARVRELEARLRRHSE